MKKVTLFSAAIVAGLFMSVSAYAQITTGTSTYGAPIDGSGAVIFGLNDSVIHVGYNAGDPAKGYNEYPTNLGIDEASVTTIQNYAATYGPSTPGYATNALNAPSYSFLNTNLGFQYSGGSNATNNYLGADAAGLALADTAIIPGTIFYASGFIDITSALVGDSYTFTINSADDAGRVTLGGQTLIEDNYFGGTGLTSPTTADVTFDSAGLYAVSIMTYQNGGGAGFSYSATPDLGSSAFSYVVEPAAVPEPSTWALMLGGVLALVVVSRRRAVRA